MRAAVDVMGGDHAPAEILRGCWDAAPLLGPDDQVLLVGPEALVTEAIESADLPTTSAAATGASGPRT